MSKGSSSLKSYEEDEWDCSMCSLGQIQDSERNEKEYRTLETKANTTSKLPAF